MEKNGKKVFGGVTVIIICLKLLSAFLRYQSEHEREEREKDPRTSQEIYEELYTAGGLSMNDIDNNGVNDQVQNEEILKNLQYAIAYSKAKDATLDQIIAVPNLTFASETDQIIIVVETTGSEATFNYYTKGVDGSWKEEFFTLADVGVGGIDPEKSEGDGRTPIGCYGFDFAFGINDNPGSKLEYKKVSDNSYWVDDEESAYYNSWVDTSTMEKSEEIDSRRLIDEGPACNYALCINYNPECEPGKGSAIFLQCMNGEGKTSGSIAVNEETMKILIQKVDQNTKILLLDDQEEINDYVNTNISANTNVSANTKRID